MRTRLVEKSPDHKGCFCGFVERVHDYKACWPDKLGKVVITRVEEVAKGKNLRSQGGLE
jgi:hypothetical protein